MKEEFINKAKLIHGNKYNYEKVNYINCKTKVIIRCSSHGEFEQTPNNHLSNKQGCPVCGGSKRLTTKEFIKKSKKIHKNKYNYEKANYVNSKTKVTLTCKKHGEFEQTPNKHLIGHGCPKCGNIEILTKENFIELSNKVHNNKYNYDKSDYTSNYKEVSIHCEQHGYFKQKPKKHLKGQGCPDCAINKKLTKEIFIKRSIKMHGNKYNYEKVNYINNSTKVMIMCKKHGKFEQTPASHLNLRGCPTCTSSKGEIIIENYLKENNIKFKSQYSFQDLKYKRQLLFDFALLDNKDNLICLIEYNGQQHYNFIKFVHVYQEIFEKSKFRDQLKMDYCIKNNIPLHVIKYNECINSKLQDILLNI